MMVHTFGVQVRPSHQEAEADSHGNEIFGSCPGSQASKMVMVSGSYDMATVSDTS